MFLLRGSSRLKSKAQLKPESCSRSLFPLPPPQCCEAGLPRNGVTEPGGKPRVAACLPERQEGPTVGAENCRRCSWNLRPGDGGAEVFQLVWNLFLSVFISPIYLSLRAGSHYLALAVRAFLAVVGCTLIESWKFPGALLETILADSLFMPSGALVKCFTAHQLLLCILLERYNLSQRWVKEF